MQKLLIAILFITTLTYCDNAYEAETANSSVEKGATQPSQKDTFFQYNIWWVNTPKISCQKVEI